MPSSIQHIEDLAAVHITLLTQLLHLPPHAQISSKWLRDQQHLITTFPFSLRRPSTILSRAILALQIYIPNRAVLCHAHKDLNPFLIRRIFLHVSAECTTRLHRLTAPDVRDSLPQDLKEWLRRLERLNSLWTKPELYRTAYRAMPDEQRKEIVASGCEACILARVGGEIQAVVDLRASCLGRTRKRKHKPRLLGIIEGWIRWSGDRERVEEESYSIGRKVREVRRELQNEKRKQKEKSQNKRDNGRTKTKRSRNYPQEVSESTEGRGASEKHDSWNDVDASEYHEHDTGEMPEEDFESRIISHYHNLISTTSVDVQIGSHVDEEHLHPAFRRSIAFSPEDGTFHGRQPDSISEFDGASDPRPSASDRQHTERTSGAYETGPYTAPARPRAPTPRSRQHQTTYSPSNYSRSSSPGSASSPPRHQVDSPERVRHRAEAYRRLVGNPETLGADDGGTERCERSVDRTRRRRGPGVREFSAPFEEDDEMGICEMKPSSEMRLGR